MKGREGLEKNEAQRGTPWASAGRLLPACLITVIIVSQLM
jgi:hypothetical protein